MSHHFDSPTAIEDGRINLCDFFAFSGRPGSTVLILTVNPDAGRSSTTTFRPDAVYEFLRARADSTTEDLAIRVRFEEPSEGGVQTYTVLLARDEASRSGADGDVLLRGETGVVNGTDDVRAWAGLVADPFWADGLALATFQQHLAQGDFRTEIFAESSSNLFTDRNVTAIAVEVPDTLLGADELSLWTRISLYGHAPQRRVSRFGQPMLRPLFFPVPGPETDALNEESPSTDTELHWAAVQQAASTTARLAGLTDPGQHGARVADAFLPDVLRYVAGRPIQFAPGTGNGRSLHDDAFGIALSTLLGADHGASLSPHGEVADFPHLGSPSTADIPALADLFGLRAQAPAGEG